MTKRQAEIMRLFACGYTGTEIGARLGITRERVRQIVTRNGGNLQLARKCRTAKKQEIALFRKKKGVCEVCRVEFFKSAKKWADLCKGCRKKYEAGNTSTYWSIFKMIARKFPEFVDAWTRRPVQRNG